MEGGLNKKMSVSRESSIEVKMRRSESGTEIDNVTIVLIYHFLSNSSHKVINKFSSG